MTDGQRKKRRYRVRLGTRWSIEAHGLGEQCGVFTAQAQNSVQVRGESKRRQSSSDNMEMTTAATMRVVLMVRLVFVIRGFQTDDLSCQIS